MRHAFASLLLATALTLGACAHTMPDQTAAMSADEIRAELAAIAEELQVQRIAAEQASPTMREYTPAIVSDSNGVLLTAYTPNSTPRSSYRSFSSSRPFGYARREALAKRRSELYAQLGQMTQPQQ